MNRFGKLIVVTVVLYVAVLVIIVAAGSDVSIKLLGVEILGIISVIGGVIGGIMLALKGRERTKVDYPAGELKDVILFKD